MFDGANACAAAEMIGTDGVVGSIVAIRVWTQTEEVLLRVVASAAPGFEVQVVVSQTRERHSRFGCPIALHAARDPKFECALVGEQIAIAETHPVREATARGQRSKLRVKAFAIEEEDGSVFGEVECPFQAI